MSCQWHVGAVGSVLGVTTGLSGWDYGITYHLEEVEKPDMALDPLSLGVVRDDHLKSPNDSLEDDYIQRLITASYRYAERKSWRSLIPQTWRQVHDGFTTSGVIILQKFPVISIESIAYLDGDGVEQVWTGSPSPYEVAIPSGPSAGKAEIRPIYNTSWPTARSARARVEVTFIAGYAAGDDGLSAIPEDITHARLLIIGEMYKQRSLSVHAFNQNPAILQADTILREYRAY